MMMMMMMMMIDSSKSALKSLGNSEIVPMFIHHQGPLTPLPFYPYQKSDCSKEFSTQKLPQFAHADHPFKKDILFFFIDHLQRCLGGFFPEQMENKKQTSNKDKEVKKKKNIPVFFDKLTSHLHCPWISFFFGVVCRAFSQKTEVG